MQSAKEAYERHFTEPVNVPHAELMVFVEWAKAFYAQGRVSIVYRPAMETEDEMWP